MWKYLSMIRKWRLKVLESLEKGETRDSAPAYTEEQ